MTSREQRDRPGVPHTVEDCSVMCSDINKQQQQKHNPGVRQATDRVLRQNLHGGLPDRSRVCGSSGKDGKFWRHLKTSLPLPSRRLQ